MAKDKTIIIPADINIEIMLPDGSLKVLEEPASFCDFVKRTLLRDKKWGESTEYLYAAMEIRGALKGKVSGDEVALDADAHKMLLEIMDKPSKDQNGNGGYNPEIAVQLGTFFVAIKHARE